MFESDVDPIYAEAHGGFAILLARAGQGALRAVEAGLRPFGVSATQYVVLLRLDERGDATAGRLVRECDIDSGAMSRLLDRLEALHLLERSPDAADRRVTRIALSTKGRTLLPALRAAVLRVQSALALGQSGADLVRFRGYLGRTLRNAALAQVPA
jgi:DNA-binding MarR family transcriptional regulator